MRRLIIALSFTGLFIAGCGGSQKLVSGATAVTTTVEGAPSTTTTIANSQNQALTICQTYVAKSNASDSGAGFKVIGGFTTSVAAAVAHANHEIATRGAAAGLQGAPTITVPTSLVGQESSSASLCYVSGQLNVSTPPGVDPPDVSMLVVVDGTPYPLLQGYSKEENGYAPLIASPPETQ